MKTTKFFLLIILVFGLSRQASAQFDINGQLIQRGEYRHGFGKLIPDSVSASGFISQRFRLQADYKSKYVELFGSIQDIRTWGSTSQANVSDAFLSLHEGWAEARVDSFWTVKVGRQELNYDNARFLGNLDWALQARSHDFALVKFTKANHKIHFGGGFNQDAEKLNGGDYYKNKNQYKMAQMIWYSFKNSAFEGSFIVWNNGMQDTTTGQRETRYSQTIGLPTLKYRIVKNNLISGFAYYQTGKDAHNRDVNAYDVNVQSTQTFNLDEEKLTSFDIILGAEMISGTNSNNTAKINNSFNPMYGTNHMHNGYMDYFFVGGRFDNSVGLNDYYFKLRYNQNEIWFVQADIHYFTSNANIYKNSEVQSAQLGSEIDITGGVIFNEVISLQAGYSQMLASSTLENLQSPKPSSNQNWAYLMLIVRPNSDKKFIGVLK